jgi:hypothetical protein
MGKKRRNKMSLASNHRFQLMKRLKRDMELAAPEFALSDESVDSGANPALRLKIAGTDVALIAIRRKSFNGFQVVAELSSSSAEGLPEHDMWVQVDTDAAGVTVAKAAKIASMAAKIGCASMKLVFSTAAPAEAQLIEANISEDIGNDARLGATGA